MDFAIFFTMMHVVYNAKLTMKSDIISKNDRKRNAMYGLNNMFLPSYNLFVTIHKKNSITKKIEENFTVANLATNFFSQSPNPNSQSPMATIRSPMSSPAVYTLRFSGYWFPMSRQSWCSKNRCFWQSDHLFIIWWIILSYTLRMWPSFSVE